MMAEPLAAALHGVAKHYHGFTLGPLNLEIPAGSIVGLIGENGAGKTTLLKLLTGVNRPDAGTVELLSATPDGAAVRAKIGVVFEDAYFYESLTPAQVGASLRGIFGPAWDAGYFAALLEQFHLPPKKSIKELSRGMRMKLNLASALAHRPELLVLDEATSGLDPAARSEILDILLDFIQDERHSVLLSSHITTDLEQIADTIAYLHHGQLLFAKNKDDLMKAYPDMVNEIRKDAAMDAINRERARIKDIQDMTLPGMEQTMQDALYGEHPMDATAYAKEVAKAAKKQAQNHVEALHDDAKNGGANGVQGGGDGQTEANITNRLGNPSAYDAFAINMVKTDNAASYTSLLNQ